MSAKTWIVDDPYAVKRMIEKAIDPPKTSKKSAPVYKSSPTSPSLPSAPVAESKCVFVSFVSNPEKFTVIHFSNENELWKELETKFGTIQRVLRMADIDAEVILSDIRDGDKLILG